MSAPDFAETLYRILPALYRTRDDSGDLRAYLDGCGALLDAVYGTLRQRYGDNFPDNPPEGAAIPPAQDWLLPYFADLVDARLLSPFADGRRDELGHAIRWRQGKGTLSVFDSIVEAIGQTEAVVQEGWRRVAVTPRLDQPLPPAVSFGYAQEPLTANPGNAARHPALPAATVDLRCASRAVETDLTNPGARTITVDGDERIYRQAAFHGHPCFPGSYEDVSRRTPDLRTPDWRVGHAHPRRILAFLPPAAGFFPASAPRRSFNPENPSEAFEALVEIDRTDPARVILRNRSLGTGAFRPVVVTNVVNLPADPIIRDWVFEGISFERGLLGGDVRITMTRAAALRVRTEASGDTPALNARDCLFRTLDVRNGALRLEACTILGRTGARLVQASDCIFTDRIAARTNNLQPVPEGGCLRFTRHDPRQIKGDLHYWKTTTDSPTFFNPDYPGPQSAVLAPATPDSILKGAEDEGEMGAYHHARHAAMRAAILEKLKDFLPVGQEAVLVPDPRLLEPPYAEVTP